MHTVFSVFELLISFFSVFLHDSRSMGILIQELKVIFIAESNI